MWRLKTLPAWRTRIISLGAEQADAEAMESKADLLVITKTLVKDDWSLRKR